MLENNIKNTKLKIGSTLDEFIKALHMGLFFIKKDISLIFLCGANKSINTPSERRNFLKKSIEKHLPHTRIVYAENVMEELVKYGKTKNLLDIEHQISHIADWILIVLESYSAFCELGAFAHNNFRKKLIVINDAKFRKEQSFINLGPIQAITDDVSSDRIIWYSMASDGIISLDSIGSTLPEIIKILKPRSNKEKVDKDSLLPNSSKQSSLFFLHDLILLCGPISHAETVAIYKLIFGEGFKFDDIKSLRGILHASGLLKSFKSNDTTLYITSTTDAFIDFGHHHYQLISAFRSHHMRNTPERFGHV